MGATSVERPPDARKRIGDLAVELGLVSREHLEFCAEHQKTLRATFGADTKRLGEILVEKGLLKPTQVDDLLETQRGEARRPRPAPARPIPAAQSARESPKAESGAARLLRAIPRWVRYLVLAPLVAGGAITVVALWPASEVQRTLDTYLRGRGESGAVTADFLAVRDLGIMVREFRVEALAASARHDYTPDLKVFNSRRDRGTWAEFSAAAEMSAEKRQAFALVLPCLPEMLTPQQMGALSVTVQPAVVLLSYKRSGERAFREERCRFVLIQVESPRWSVGWRVAAFEPI